MLTHLDGAVDRVAWFKAAIQGTTGPVSDEEMHLLTQRFVSSIPQPGRILTHFLVSSTAKTKN
jgi:hypothetical protein